MYCNPEVNHSPPSALINPDMDLQGYPYDHGLHAQAKHACLRMEEVGRVKERWMDCRPSCSIFVSSADNSVDSHKWAFPFLHLLNLMRISCGSATSKVPGKHQQSFQSNDHYACSTGDPEEHISLFPPRYFMTCSHEWGSL